MSKSVNIWLRVSPQSYVTVQAVVEVVDGELVMPQKLPRPNRDDVKRHEDALKAEIAAIDAKVDHDSRLLKTP